MMTIDDVSSFLIFLSAFDNRDSGPEQAYAWHLVIGERADLESAKESVIEHYRGLDRHSYFTVAHVIDYLDHRASELARRIHRGGEVFDGLNNKLEPILDETDYPTGQYRHIGRPDLDQLALEAPSEKW
jgi:hypothetical protein